MRVLWLLLVLAAPLGAQPLTFVNEGGPPGGLLPVAHETTSGVWLAVDEIGRLGRSTDGGATWGRIDLRGVNAFAEGPGELLAATGNGVWRSADDGATWAAFALEGQHVARAARAHDGSLFALLRHAGQSAVVHRGAAESVWDTVRVSSGRGIDLARGQDAQVYVATLRSASYLSLQTILYRWNATSARLDSLHTVGGALRGMDATPDGRIYLATAALGLLDMPYGRLDVFTPGEGWKGHGTYAASLNVQPSGVYVGGLQDVQRLTPDGLVKHAAIAAPVTMLAGRTGLLASTGTECYSTIDGTPPCDLPTSAYRIDPQTGATAPVGFGQQALYVISDIDGLTAVGRTGIWKRTQQCDSYGCTLDANWTFERVSPSYPDLARNLAPTPWGDLLLSADYWYGPGLFVGNDSTWESRVPADFGISAIALGDSVILSLHANGLWRSADRGETFEQVSDDYEEGGALFDIFGSTPYWGRKDGVYVTGDDGKTWTRIFDTTPYGPVRAVDDWSDHDLWGSYVLAGRHMLRSTFSGQWEVESVLPESAALGGYPDEVEMAMGRYVRVRDMLWVYDYDTSAWSGNAIPPGASWQGHRMTVAPDGYLYLATASGLLRSEQPVLVDTENQPAPASTTPLHVWPNPAAAAVTIQPGSKAGRVEVFDGLGRRVATVEGAGPRLVLDVSGWPAGVYFARVAGSAAVPFVVAR